MNQNEFEALIADKTKVINGDISWSDDEDHSPSVEFRAEIESDAGYPLFVRGSYNPLAQALSYVIIHRGVGRIYALDIGKDHHNPSCHHVGEKHKHCWDERLRDKHAYVPEDITAGIANPVKVWRQFCAEACIDHRGKLLRPPALQMELF